MKNKSFSILNKSLFSWSFSGQIKLQIILVLIICITVFIRVIPLEMQKRIVNEAIKLRNADLLLIYSGIYFVSIVFAGILKYLSNICQTIISQRALSNMRKDFYDHILTLPVTFFRTTSPGMVVTTLINELASAGEYAGIAIAVPITSILSLLVFFIYLIYLNSTLGLVSLVIYPVVIFLIPFLQKKASAANRKRMDITRNLSNKITESIAGIHEIQANGAFAIETFKFNKIVDKLYKIRIKWNLFKFSIKASNNFFNNLSPFIIFIIGGYLSINGRLELGVLVVFLSVQEKLFDPWKELIEYYQTYQDALVRYKKAIEYFDEDPFGALEPAGRDPYIFNGKLEVKDLSFATDDGVILLDKINFSINPGEHLAIIGFSGSGKSTLIHCINKLYKYTGGHVYIDGKEVKDLSIKDVALNIGFVSQTPYLFDATIKENLLYSYMSDKISCLESLGNCPTLDDLVKVLQETDMFIDVLHFGLNTILSSEKYHDLISVIVAIRNKFIRLYGDNLSDYVEFFDETKYQYNCSIYENLVFGVPNQKAPNEKGMDDRAFFINFLNETGLTKPLEELGIALATQVVNILKNLPYEGIFFEQSPISYDEFEEYKLLVDQIKKSDHKVTSIQQKKILELALRFTPGKHKVIALSDNIEKMILKGRKLFRNKVITGAPGRFSFYKISDYLYSQSILNNIIFGKVKDINPFAKQKITQHIVQLFVEEDILERIIEIGMEFTVGSKGEKLSGGQRQKIAIARIILKDPGYLIMDEATSSLDNKSQARIQNLINSKKGKVTIISVVHRLNIIKNFDKIAVMKASKIVEMGTYKELIANKGILYELLQSSK